MKRSIRYPPWAKIPSGFMLGIFLSFTVVPFAIDADVCDKKPDLPKCSPGGHDSEFPLTLTYEFGDCTYDCVTSAVTAKGTQRCDQSGNCSFRGTIEEETVLFYLPVRLIELLTDTDWKGQDLYPEECFGPDLAADAGGRGVELAANGDGTWFAAIGSTAKDGAGDIPRKYVFYFLCDNPEYCVIGDWTANSMLGTYDGGELLRIEADAKDRGGKSIPCRCTISSEPNCPGNTDVPMKITVTEP